MASQAFNQETSATEVAATFKSNIEGKTILITGVSPNSIGEWTARSLASGKPALLMLASRTKEKVEAVMAEIKREFPDVKITLVLLDLSSQASVRKAAREINGITDHIDILINNAGMMIQTTERPLSPDGIELHLATNHIGHFLLTNLLLPKLEAAAARDASGSVRIVNVSSRACLYTAFRFHDWNFDGKPIPPEEEPHQESYMFMPPNPNGVYHGMVAYGQSKVANILFSVYLRQHLTAKHIQVFSCHPGAINSGLSRGIAKKDFDNLLTIKGIQWKTTNQGAATSVVAALDPKLDEHSAIYLQDCQQSPSAPWAEDEKFANQLWKLSEELVKQEFPL